MNYACWSAAAAFGFMGAASVMAITCCDVAVMDAWPHVAAEFYSQDPRRLPRDSNQDVMRLHR
jgi:hypothetical protein